MPCSFRDGFPRITIEVIGSKTGTIEAIIDTGYDGYLSLPSELALPLGLTLEGTGRARMADGSISGYYKYRGVVQYEDIRVNCTVDVHDNHTAILGLDMLKELKKTLIVDSVNQTVRLENNVK